MPSQKRNRCARSDYREMLVVLLRDPMRTFRKSFRQLFHMTLARLFCLRGPIKTGENSVNRRGIEEM